MIFVEFYTGPYTLYKSEYTDNNKKKQQQDQKFIKYIFN